MPDGDRYNRNVEKRWQKAARYAYERDDSDLVVREVVRALGDMPLEDDGVVLRDMIRLGATANLCPEVRAELERAARRGHSEVTLIAVDRILLFLSAPSLVVPESIGEDMTDGHEVAIARDILVQVAWVKMSPMELQRSLKRLNPLEQMARLSRLERNLAEVRRSPVIDQIAHQIMYGGDAPGSRRVVTPRISKPSQDELVYSPVTL
jgi:hypothetical protein